jgi:hypothetical protein
MRFGGRLSFIGGRQWTWESRQWVSGRRRRAKASGPSIERAANGRWRRSNGHCRAADEFRRGPDGLWPGGHAPKGHRHKAWGFSPRSGSPQVPEVPKGRRHWARARAREAAPYPWGSRKRSGGRPDRWTSGHRHSLASLPLESAFERARILDTADCRVRVDLALRVRRINNLGVQSRAGTAIV